MPEKYTSLIDLLNAWVGAAATTIIAAGLGRLVWHTTEVRRRRRRLFGWELCWELPIAVCMALIGESLASWLGLNQSTGIGLIAALSYLGPRGSEVLFLRWFGKWVEKQP